MIALLPPRDAWAVMLIAALVFVVVPAPGMVAQLAVCLPLAALFGLPHGAADWWIAADRLPARMNGAPAWVWAPAFGLAYLLVALTVVAGIAIVPHVALVAFICVSAWHFGEHDATALGTRGTLATALALGIIPIAGPGLFWPTEFSGVLAALGVTAAPATVQALAACACANAMLVVVAGLAAYGHMAMALREQAACLLLAAAAPPLVSFTVYFCLVHSPRQADSLSVKGDPRVVYAAAAAAAIMIAAGAILAGNGRGVSAPSVALTGIFWGLAVLTFPHVLCGHLLGDTAHRASARLKGSMA